MKYLILLLSINACFADNSDFFNQAYQTGKQNNFNLNLNQNSTFDSYGQVNHFESSVANNANAGNANAQNMYNNTYADNANPNYLYNEGTKDIADCQTKSDPRCTTLNKYGDKDTQAQLQAYGTGISTKYYLTVRPDPADSSCSFVTHKVAINSQSHQCISSAHTQTACDTSLKPYTNAVGPSPSDGTVIASGSSTSRACGGAQMSSSATVVSIEALTKGNQAKLHFENNGNNNCGGNNSQSLDINLPMSSYSSQVYRNDQQGCGGGHWDIGGAVNISGGCQGNSCAYTVDVEAFHGGDCNGHQHTTYNLNFAKPIAGYVESGVIFTDNCSSFKASH